MSESKQPEHISPIKVENLVAGNGAGSHSVRSRTTSPARRPVKVRADSSSAWMVWLGLGAGGAVAAVVGVLAFNSFHIPGSSAAQQAECDSNMKAIGTACIAYADAHQGKYPGSFIDMLASNGVAPETLVCPSSHDTPAEGSPEDQAAALATGGHVSYIWLGRDMSKNSPADAVLAYEPLANHNYTGIHVLYNDYHVEWLNGPAAKQLIDSLNVLAGEERQDEAADAIKDAAETAKERRDELQADLKKSSSDDDTK